MVIVIGLEIDENLRMYRNQKNDSNLRGECGPDAIIKITNISDSNLPEPKEPMAQNHGIDSSLSFKFYKFN